MDNQIDVEAVRARYRALSHAEAMRIATQVGIPKSTANKFRMGYVKEVGAYKLAKINNALVDRAMQAAAAPAQKSV